MVSPAWSHETSKPHGNTYREFNSWEDAMKTARHAVALARRDVRQVQDRFYVWHQGTAYDFSKTFVHIDVDDETLDTLARWNSPHFIQTPCPTRGINVDFFVQTALSALGGAGLDRVKPCVERRENDTIK